MGLDALTMVSCKALTSRGRFHDAKIVCCSGYLEAIALLNGYDMKDVQSMIRELEAENLPRCPTLGQDRVCSLPLSVPTQVMSDHEVLELRC